jgi:hypothetical protein
MSRIHSKTFAIERLVPNPWNPNVMDDEMYRKELASLRKFGYVSQILVRELPDQVQIIDGENRWKGLKHLGFTEVDTTVVEGLTDEEAKQLTIVLNETRGRADPKKLGLLLQDLLVAIPKTDLLDVLPLSPIQFDRLAGLEGFDWGTLGKDEPSGNRWVERTYRLPVDAALVIDEAIEKAKDGEEILDWQALEMVAADFLASTSAMPSRQPTARASSAGRR